MQRLSSGLVIVRSINEGPMVLCELPSGDWVLGTDRNAQPITSTDEIKAYASESTMALVQASIDRRKQIGAPTPAAAPVAVYSEDGRVPASLRQEIDEVVQAYLSMTPDIRQQVKGMLEAFVGHKSVEVPIVDDLPVTTRTAPASIFKSASQEMFPGRTVTKEEPMSGGVMRTYDNGQREFIPDAVAIDRQMATEAKQAEPDAAPAYECVFCSKGYPGERSRDLHQERCSARPREGVPASA